MNGMTGGNADALRVKVWDWPTRVFHWGLLLCLVGLWYTSTEFMLFRWHKWLGYTVLGLLLFRIVWGFVGSETARFRHWLAGPVTVARYAWGRLRGTAPEYLGHNPLGGWAILLMLVLLLVQAVTGLFANDDIFNQGPLADSVSRDVERTMTRLHNWNFDLLLIVIGIHVLAVFTYQFILRIRLIGAMITGYKRGAWSDHPHIANPWFGLVLALMVAALVFGVGSVWG
nr:MULTISPECIES: cytochrome b/b6 domain-containing protein [unclassified Thioalkalivibrio]